MREITTDEAPSGGGPFSQGIVEGNTIYTAGQGGIDPDTGAVVDGGIRPETEQTMANIAAILDAAGASFDDVVKVNAYLGNIDDYDDFNDVYRTFFTAPYPARSVVEVPAFPREIVVEIETVARLPE